MADDDVDPVAILRKILDNEMGYVDPGIGLFDCSVDTFTDAEVAYLEALRTPD